MLQNKHNIVLYIVAGLLVYLIFTTNGIKTDIKGYKDRIETIQTKIDSAQAINKQIDTKVDSVKQNVVAITKEIHHIEKCLTEKNINIIEITLRTEFAWEAIEYFKNSKKNFFERII